MDSKGGVQDLAIKEIKAHFDSRIDQVGRDFAVLSRENAELKRGLASVLSDLARKVDPEYFQWIFVILGTGSNRAAARLLGLSNSSFDKRLKRYVARGGLYGVLYSMVQVRFNQVGRKRMERFNELYLNHQGAQAVAEEDAVTELLNGLEDMHEGNWQGMRDELIGIARDMIVDK